MQFVIVEVHINGLPFTIQMEEQEARERGLLKDAPKSEPKKTGKK